VIELLVESTSPVLLHSRNLFNASMSPLGELFLAITFAHEAQRAILTHALWPYHVKCEGIATREIFCGVERMAGVLAGLRRSSISQSPPNRQRQKTETTPSQLFADKLSQSSDIIYLVIFSQSTKYLSQFATPFHSFCDPLYAPLLTTKVSLEGIWQALTTRL